MRNGKNIHVTFETATVIRVILLVVVTILGLMFLSKIIQPLILIVVSFFLAIGLNPIVSWIASIFKSQNRVLATGIAYSLVIGFLIAFFSFVFPPLVKQTVDFVKEIPQTLQTLKNEDGTVKTLVDRYNLQEEVDKFTNDLGGRVSDFGKPALSTAGKIGTTLLSIVTVLVLTFMMLVEGPAWIEKYFKSLKPKSRSHQKKLARQMYKVIVGYVNGQVLIAGIGGLFAAITLFIASQITNADINPIALGGIVALFALLPLIGTTLGSVIVVLACLLVNVPLAIIMAIYFIIYQQIENVTIQPFIQSRTNTLTPLLVFVSAILGVGLGGLLGALLAIPVAGCLKVIADDYFESKKIKPLTHADVS